MKFPYRILTEWSDDDACYVARVPAFPNLAAHGATAGDAASEAQIAAEGMIEVLGDKAPASDHGAASGNIRLRLPPYLHANLSRLATVEGVSLNQLMVTMLAEQIGARSVASHTSIGTAVDDAYANDLKVLGVTTVKLPRGTQPTVAAINHASKKAKAKEKKRGERPRADRPRPRSRAGAA